MKWRERPAQSREASGHCCRDDFFLEPGGGGRVGGGQPAGRERGLRVGWGAVGAGVRAHGPRPVAQAHQGFQLAPLQRLVPVARAREAEFLQELGEARPNHGERAAAPRSTCSPAGGRPCLRVSVPGEARVGSASPSLLGQVQVTREPPTCPPQVRPRPWGGAARSAHLAPPRPTTWPGSLEGASAPGEARVLQRHLRARAASHTGRTVKVTWSGRGGEEAGSKRLFKMRIPRPLSALSPWV